MCLKRLVRPTLTFRPKIHVFHSAARKETRLYGCFIQYKYLQLFLWPSLKRREAVLENGQVRGVVMSLAH